MHRIRVGLTGLACVFLIVMLAAVVLRMSGAIPTKSDTGGTTTTNTAEAPNEPLAQLGVAPGTPDGEVLMSNSTAKTRK